MAEKETISYHNDEPSHEDLPSNNEAFSEVYFSELHAQKKPLENKKVASVIDSFILNFRESIEAFIGCKIQFAFQSVEHQNSKKFNQPQDMNILTGFSISNMTENGMFCFGYEFLDPILSILYDLPPL